MRVAPERSGERLGAAQTDIQALAGGMDDRAQNDIEIGGVRAGDGEGLALEIDILVIQALPYQNGVTVIAGINRVLDAGVVTGHT